jgi:RNA polymerase sigma-70 factor (ECF subfamily)
MAQYPDREDSGAGPGFRIKRSLDEGGDRRALTRAIRSARDGDRDALAFIYARYADNIFSYARTIVRDDHTAEDVTQQVFTKLLTRIHMYEERSVPFAAWLLRIARNAAIDHVRGNRTIACEDVHAVDDSPQDGGAPERRQALDEALEELPEGQQQVVLLRHVVGLSPGEIAARMGRSEGAIHTLHHRARRALRRELERREAAPAVR